MKFLNSKEARKKFPHITICDGAQIDEHANIGEGSYIGENAIIYENTNIRKNVTVGEGSYIESGAIIYDGAKIEGYTIIGKGATIWYGAVIRYGAIIRKGGEGLVLHGAYKYPAGVYFDSRIEEIIVRLGCYHRTVEEWESNFDNNINEFPRGSHERKARWQTFQFLKKWKPSFKTQIQVP